MNEAIDRLTTFFDEMTAWEIEANKIAHVLRSDPSHEPFRKRLLQIQEEYCTPGAKCRGYSVELPPTYSKIVVESTEQTSKTKIVVHARDVRGGLDDQYLFTIVFKGERWMLAERIFINCDGMKRQFYF